jgi:hypothetical protein
MLEKIFLATIRFYEHNDPLVFLIALVLVAFFFLIIKPRRRVVFLLLGCLMLILQFEYTKVIFKELKSDWLGQIFSQDFHFRRQLLAMFFFQDIIPLLMSILGWTFLALSALVP